MQIEDTIASRSLRQHQQHYEQYEQHERHHQHWNELPMNNENKIDLQCSGAKLKRRTAGNEIQKRIEHEKRIEEHLVQQSTESE